MKKQRPLGSEVPLALVSEGAVAAEVLRRRDRDGGQIVRHSTPPPVTRTVLS